MQEIDKSYNKTLERDGLKAAPQLIVCARHVLWLPGCKSPDQVFKCGAEGKEKVQGRRREAGCDRPYTMTSVLRQLMRCFFRKHRWDNDGKCSRCSEYRWPLCKKCGHRGPSISKLYEPGYEYQASDFQGTVTYEDWYEPACRACGAWLNFG